MSAEITELQAVDFALGAVIANSFNSLSATGPENFQSFLARPIKEKVFRADHDEAGNLVRKIANAKKGAGAATDSGSRLPVLPVVAYFRKPGLSNGEEKARVWGKSMWNDELLASMRLTALPLSLDYTMRFVAWDKPTLDKMQLAWYAYIGKPGRLNSKFIVPYRIGAEVLEVPAVFMDPRTVMFSDVSPEGVGRIYAVETQFSVLTQALVGEAVVVPEEFEIWGITTSYLTGGGTV